MIIFLREVRTKGGGFADISKIDQLLEINISDNGIGMNENEK